MVEEALFTLMVIPAAARAASRKPSIAAHTQSWEAGAHPARMSCPRRPNTGAGGPEPCSMRRESATQVPKTQPRSCVVVQS